MSKWITEELKRVRDNDLTARVFSWDRNISFIHSSLITDSNTLRQMNQLEYMQMKDRERGEGGGLNLKNRCKARYVQKRKTEIHKTLYTTAEDRCYCVPQGSERKRVGRIQGKKGHLKTCFDSHTFLHRKSRRGNNFNIVFRTKMLGNKVWNIGSTLFCSMCTFLVRI